MPNDRLSTLPTYSTASTTRLKALYSDISRQKHSNPTSFQTNVDWWKRTLTDFVGHGLQPSSSDVLSLTVSRSLQENLRYNGAGKPLGLASVVVRQTLLAISINKSIDEENSQDSPNFAIHTL